MTLAARARRALGARSADAGRRRRHQRRRIASTLADGRTVFVKTHASRRPACSPPRRAGLAWLPTASTPRAARARGRRRLPRARVARARRRGPTPTSARPRARRAAPRSARRASASIATNFLATLPQDNTPERRLADVLVERRLRPLVSRAARLGARARSSTRCAQHPERFGPAEPPARLHGDLWWGNVVVVRRRAGDHRSGGLRRPSRGRSRDARAVRRPAATRSSPRTTRSFPLADGWRERVALWQLYPLAAHAVLFGGGYARRSRRTLARFTNCRSADRSTSMTNVFSAGEWR